MVSIIYDYSQLQIYAVKSSMFSVYEYVQSTKVLCCYCGRACTLKAEVSRLSTQVSVVLFRRGP